MKSPACQVVKVEVTEEYGSKRQKPVRSEVALASVEDWTKKPNVEEQNAEGGYANETMKPIEKKKKKRRVVSTFMRS